MARAKFRVDEKVPYPNNDGYRIILNPLANGAENEAFYKETPGGSITLVATRAAAAAEFQLDQEYYVDFARVGAAVEVPAPVEAKPSPEPASVEAPVAAPAPAPAPVAAPVEVLAPVEAKVPAEPQAPAAVEAAPAQEAAKAKEKPAAKPRRKLFARK